MLIASRRRGAPKAMQLEPKEIELKEKQLKDPKRDQEAAA
jgi:hypothetical protein